DTVLSVVIERIQDALSIEIFNLVDQITEKVAKLPLTVNRQFFQIAIDASFKKLGRYEISGSTEEAIKNIEAAAQGVDQWRNLYEVARAPFSTAVNAIASGVGRVYESISIVTSPTPVGEFFGGVFSDLANITGSVADGILPIGSVATVLLGGTAIMTLTVLVPTAWFEAVGWSSPSDLPSELILSSPWPIERYFAPFMPFPIENSPLLAYVRSSGSRRFAPIRSRSRQLSEYEAVVNQIKSALQSGNYEQVMQLARNLKEATDAVSDAIAAKSALVLKALTPAFSKDSTFPARARQATDSAETSTFYRREFMLRVCSYLAAESDDAGNKALQSADVALQKTQE
ncbi:MAG: hypothetical protein ACK40X_14720, partial [Armatimonadota bacterium]